MFLLACRAAIIWSLIGRASGTPLATLLSTNGAVFPVCHFPERGENLSLSAVEVPSMVESDLMFS